MGSSQLRRSPRAWKSRSWGRSFKFEAHVSSGTRHGISSDWARSRVSFLERSDGKEMTNARVPHCFMREWGSAFPKTNQPHAPIPASPGGGSSWPLIPSPPSLPLLELLDDFLRNRTALRFRWLPRHAHRPHTLLQPFHRQRFTAKQPMLHAKTTGAPLRDARLDTHHIPKRRRREKIAACLNQRNSGDLESLQHFRLWESQCLVKQCIGAPIEIFKITREKHNSKRVAVAPFNQNLFSMCQHFLSRFALPIGSAESTPLFHFKASHLLFLCAFTVDCLRGNTLIP